MKKLMLQLLLPAAAVLQACVTPQFATTPSSAPRDTSPIVHTKQGARIQLTAWSWKTDESGNITGPGQVLGEPARPFDGTIQAADISRIEWQELNKPLTAIVTASAVVGGIYYLVSSMRSPDDGRPKHGPYSSDRGYNEIMKP